MRKSKMSICTEDGKGLATSILIWNKKTGFIAIRKGNGSTDLTTEDEESGKVDYMFVSFYKYNRAGFIEEVETDLPDCYVMLDDLYFDKFKNVEEIIDYCIATETVPDHKYVILYAEQEKAYGKK